MSRWQRAALWGLRQQKRIRAWIFRAATFYFGFRILQHEIYETETSEPILVILGLWLCGIAPATFFDSLRKGAANFQRDLEKATQEAGVAGDVMPSITEDPNSRPGVKAPPDGNQPGGS